MAGLDSRTRYWLNDPAPYRQLRQLRLNQSLRSNLINVEPHEPEALGNCNFFLCLRAHFLGPHPLPAPILIASWPVLPDRTWFDSFAFFLMIRPQPKTRSPAKSDSQPSNSDLDMIMDGLSDETLAREGQGANALIETQGNVIKAKPLAKLPYRVCSGCRQYINGEMVQALGRCFHPQHFVCSSWYFPSSFPQSPYNPCVGKTCFVCTRSSNCLISVRSRSAMGRIMKWRISLCA